MKTKKSLLPFIKTPNGICPFCNVPLLPYTNSDHSDRHCSTGRDTKNGPYCPYHFVIRPIPLNVHWSHLRRNKKMTSLNVMECVMKGARLWAFKDAPPSIIMLGEFHHITYVVLPLEKIDFNDMTKMQELVDIMLTFS